MREDKAPPPHESSFARLDLLFWDLPSVSLSPPQRRLGGRRRTALRRGRSQARRWRFLAKSAEKGVWPLFIDYRQHRTRERWLRKLFGFRI